jgi:hypothetical protein
MNRKLQYVWQRLKNATRMLRHGEFRKIAQVFVGEIRHYFKKVPDSSYHDATRLVPPSYRPTRLRVMPPPDFHGDQQQVAEKIREILTDIEIDKVGEP